MTLVARVATRAALVAFGSLIVITRPANREATVIASYEELTIVFEPNLITTNTTCLGQLLLVMVAVIGGCCGGGGRIGTCKEASHGEKESLIR